MANVYGKNQLGAIRTLAALKVGKDGKTIRIQTAKIIELLEDAGVEEQFLTGYGKLDCTKIQVVLWARAELERLALVKPAASKGRAVPAKVEAPVLVEATQPTEFKAEEAKIRELKEAVDLAYAELESAEAYSTKCREEYDAIGKKWMDELVSAAESARKALESAEEAVLLKRKAWNKLVFCFLGASQRMLDLLVQADAEFNLPDDFPIKEAPAPAETPQPVTEATLAIELKEAEAQRATCLTEYNAVNAARHGAQYYNKPNTRELVSAAESARKALESAEEAVLLKRKAWWTQHRLETRVSAEATPLPCFPLRPHADVDQQEANECEAWARAAADSYALEMGDCDWDGGDVIYV